MMWGWSWVMCLLKRYGISVCGSCAYLLIIFSLFFYMIGGRIPYVSNSYELLVVECFLVWFLFATMAKLRVINFRKLFVSLMPHSGPLWLACFVFTIELVSYFFIRGVVLVIRPVLNLIFGYYALGYSAYLIFEVGNYWVGVPIMVVVICYEVFAAVLHWYIVCVILEFSRND